MKKIILAGALTALLLCGCSANNTNNANTGSENINIQEAKAEQPDYTPLLDNFAKMLTGKATGEEITGMMLPDAIVDKGISELVKNGEYSSEEEARTSFYEYMNNIADADPNFAELRKIGDAGGEVSYDVLTDEDLSSDAIKEIENALKESFGMEELTIDAVKHLKLNVKVMAQETESDFNIFLTDGKWYIDMDSMDPAHTTEPVTK